MKRTIVLLAITAAIYVVSWFLPVVEGGATLAKGTLPGWEAFRVALSPIWPHEWIAGADSWVSGVVSVLSGLTNVWFVASLAVLAVGSPRFTHVVFWGLVLATLINALWFVLPSERSDLLIGYYLWLGSFVVLAAVARSILSTRRSSEPSAAA